MTARDDSQIPDLETVAAAAAKFGISRQRVHRLVDRNKLVSVRAGRLILLSRDQVDAVAANRHRGDPWDHDFPTPDLPRLASPDEAAQILGYAQGNWVRELYHRGDIPGRLVGSDIVFRLALVKHIASQRAALALADTRPDVP